MFIKKQIEIANSLLDAGIPTIYYDAEMITSKGKNYPAISNGNDYLRLSPTDTKGIFAYIRRNGIATAQKKEVGSCSHAYLASGNFRVVIFSPKEKNNNQLLDKLLRTVLMKNVSLSNFNADKWTVAKQESPNDTLQLSAENFYCYIDVVISEMVIKNECPVDCCTEPNPIKRLK